MTHIHVCQSISGALKNWTQKEWLFMAEINKTSSDTLREQFRIMEYEGKKVIPFGDPCEGFSYQTGCPGHEVVK